ncbi:MAG TPA: 4-vinyl reductase [Anaerolineales bacterium]|nr:4-vinyl reductase [Anaerolineales bacterium]
MTDSAIVQEAGLSNTIFRHSITAAEAIVGKDDLNAVLYSAGLSRFVNKMPSDDLNLSITHEEYARLNEAIERRYGRGGRGVLQRIGRQMFQDTLKSQGAFLGLLGTTMRLFPKSLRIRFMLTSLARSLQNTNPSVEAEVEEQDGKIAYVERSCAVCHGRTSEQPICHIHIGELSEAVRWVVGEKHEIRETLCIAMGDDACRFEVIEKPTK